MPWIEKEGRTVDEARAAAVERSGRTEDELEIEVLHEGAKGLFGLGGEPAVVRVRPKEEAQDVRSAFQDDFRPGVATAEAGSAQSVAVSAPAETVTGSAEPVPDEEDAAERLDLTERQDAAQRVAVEIVEGVLQRMGLGGEVATRVAGGTIYVEVFGDDMGILIGRSGATLEALQELVRAGVQRRVKARQAVVVDIEAYWERRRTRRRGGDRQDRD